MSVPASGNGASVVQDQIVDVAGRILALVDLHHYSSFTSVIADPDGHGLFLCWRQGDPLPSELVAIVNSPGQPITVTRKDAPYSRSELDARVGTLLGSVSLGSQIGGVIHEVTVPEEGTGLVAGVLPFNPTVDPGQFVAVATPILSAAVGVPVTVRVKRPSTPLVGSRRADASPWFGGARLVNYTFNPPRHCSSGFGVTAGGVDYLLTAAHCFLGALGESVHNGVPAPNATEIGKVALATDRDVKLDAERIKITNQDGVAGNRIYQGGVGVNESTDPVVGTRRNVVNLFVVTSGSMSGTHGLLKIVDTRVRYAEVIAGIQVTFGPHVKAVALAIGPGQPVAAARGDSGGPVVQPEAQSTNVHAVGTISRGSEFFACRVFDGTECSSDVFYPDITDVLKRWGLALK